MNRNTIKGTLTAIFFVSSQIYIQNMFQMADSFVIGKYDEIAVSAINIATQPTNIIRKILFSIVMGYMILCPRINKKSGNEECRNLGGIATIMLIICVGLFTIVLRLFADEIITSLVKDEIIKLYAARYLKISCYTMVFQNLNILFTAVLRCFEFEKYSFHFNILASVLNLSSDVIIVATQNENVIEWVALSTLLSQILCFVLMLVFTNRNKLISFHFNYNEMKDLLIIGFPASADSLIYTVIQSFVNTLICNENPLMLTAYIYMTNLSNILTSISEGIGNVVGIKIGRLCGERDYNLVKKLLDYTQRSYAGINVIFLTIWVVIFGIIVNNLNYSNELIELMKTFLPFFTITIYMQSLNICTSNLLKCCGDSKFVFLTTIITSIIVKIICANILAYNCNSILIVISSILLLDEGIRCGVNYKRIKNIQFIKVIQYGEEEF